MNFKKLVKFKNELDSISQLIETSPTTDFIKKSKKLNNLNFQDKETKSLLSRCARICDEEEVKKKPLLRVIHHFACSGGTLISKCLSALPNVYVLSEVHPLSKNHLHNELKYCPTDITTLARYANVPDADELAVKLFIRNVIDTEKFIRERGGILVIREHTHMDYCLGGAANTQSTVNECLKEHFELKHIVTVRDPVDSYHSLKLNKWVQFTPDSFDEYCKRLSIFISHYKTEDITKYEDFVSLPEQHLENICTLLELPYNERFNDIFDIFKVTGDSGRRGVKIEPRERRKLSKQFYKEIKSSSYYRKLAKKLNYKKIT
ncbi:hypothetical protein AB6T38_06730 [Aliiglaciecola sp. SL4]|uniref:hypothetical protein n=1 Tax=Aliiglaciecola sp. SL4 TaxID=3239806 RepID=UPI00355B2685